MADPEQSAATDSPVAAPGATPAPAPALRPATIPLRGISTAAPRRSFLQQVTRDTFRQWGARAGLAWISLIAFFGVFAPFIANTHPILMKLDGRWSSPMWLHLFPIDVALPLLAFAVAGQFLIFPSRGLQGVLGGLLFFVLVAPILWWPTIHPIAAPLLAGHVLQVFSTPLIVVAKVGVLVVYALLLTGLIVNVRWSSRQWIGHGIAAVVIATFFFFVPLHPPETVNYQQYREAERAGRVGFIARTLIPYSATDRLRDFADARLTPPSWFPPIKSLLHYVAPGRFNAAPANDVAKLAALPAWTLLGTETDGADLASRMIHGTRIALAVGIISTSISLLIGCFIGGLMGYFVGKVDLVGMRFIEIFEAIPGFLVLISIMAAWGRDLYLMMAVIGVLGWTGTARFVRAEFLKYREQDFVQAAIASGLRRTAIIYRHILPNALTPVLVTATFGVAGAILTEATLSFLGLGLIDEPSWGQMLQQARSGGQGFVWWMAIFPGLAIFLTVYAYALIGDSVRDALDPKLKKRD